MLGIIDSMDLSGNDIHDSMLSSIVEKWGSSLREIDLALNHCGLCAVDAVGTVLQSPGCKLTVRRCHPCLGSTTVVCQPVHDVIS